MSQPSIKPLGAPFRSLFLSLAVAFLASLTAAPQQASAQQVRWLGLDEQGQAIRQEFVNSAAGRRAPRIETIMKVSLEGIRARRDFGRVVSLNAIAGFFHSEVEEEFGPIEDARSIQSGELEYLIKMTLLSRQLGTDSAFDVLAVTAIRYFQSSIDTLAQREVGNPANKLRRIERWMREMAPSYEDNNVRYEAFARIYEFLTKETLESQMVDQQVTANVCNQLLRGGN